MSFEMCVDKQTVVYLHNGILLNDKKKYVAKPQKNM